MKNKGKRLLMGSVIILVLCLTAIKLEVIPVVCAKVQDAMSDTVTISYDTSRHGGGGVSVSSDGKQMAFCKGTQEFFIQELSSGKIITYPTQNKVYQVKYSPNCKYLVAGRNVFNLQTGQISPLITEAIIAPNLEDNIAFSPDGASVAIVSEKWGDHPELATVEIWNLQTQQLMQTLPMPHTYIPEMSFSRDGRYLAIAGRVIAIWDIQEGKCVKTLVTESKSEYKSLKHNTDYTTIAYSPDGKYLTAGVVSVYIKQGIEYSIQENFIEIWDIEQGEVVKTLEWNNRITSKLRYSPDGRYLATGRSVGMDDNIRDVVWIWDVNSWQVVKKLTQFPDYHIMSMDYSADGNYLSVSGSWHTKIWKIQ